MQPTGKSTIQVPKRIIFSFIFLPLFVGFVMFTNMLGNPRFQDIRGIDVMRLILIGWCGGMAFAGFMMLIKSKLRKG